ncbi:hypothetical protein AU252_20280 [Pseudarthrobacter sulfonivorans]|uniref:Preprotein translocase subunit SecA n=1 Tax=Pseudarthrobacter sulfonivorans TaxID=121292 RepID=A0A0U3PLE2_9MICC|nr:hypothetical protein AU252_20280 [Pseudarthrobacter sulfonivorans]
MFAANVQRAGNGLIAAESWDDLRDQVPSVLAEAVRSIRDGLGGMDLWDVLEVLRQLTAHGDLGEFRESLNTSLPAVVEVVALIGLANDSDLEPPVNNASAGQKGPAIPQILEAAERIVRLAQLVAISSSSDTHLGRTAELTGLLRTFEVTVRGRNYLSISRQIVQSIFGPAPIRDLTSRHASFTPDDVSGLWDAIQKCRQKKHEGNIARFENLVEVTEAGVSLSPDQILEGRTLFESLFAAPGQGISFTAAELATLSGLATNIVKDILNCFSLDSVPVSAYEACKKFVHGENLLSGKGMLRRADSYLAIGDPMPHDYVRPVIEARLKKHTKPWSQYQRHRDRWVESSAGETLAKLLGVSSSSVRSLEYRAPDPAAGQCDLSKGSRDPFANSLDTEADALLVIDDVAVCVEVKAGSITDKARSGNVKRVETDLRKTIGEAAEQASRLESLVREHHGLWTPKGKWLDLSDVQEVHTVVVCLDDWGPLAIATDALVRAEILQSETIPWLVSLHDLLVISSIMTRPADFLTYLRRRTDPSTSRLLMASDELDIAMWYISGGLYFEPDPDSVHKRYPLTARPTQADRKLFRRSNVRTHVVTHTDPLDAWMYYTEGQTEIPAARPERKHVAPVEELVDSLHQRKVRGWLRAGADLAALSQESQELMAEHVQRIVAMTVQDAGFHTSLQTYAGPWGHLGFFIGSKPPTWAIAECADRLRNYVRLKKHQLQLDRSMGILIDTAGQVVWAEYTNAAHLPDLSLDQEVAASGLLTPAQMRSDGPKPPQVRRKKKPKKPRRR